MPYEVVARPTEKKGAYEVVSRPKNADPKPGGSLMDHYNRLLGESTGAMREGMGKMIAPGASFGQRALGAGQTALGGLQYAYSPISALSRRLVGNPVESVAGGVGASPETQVRAGDIGGMAGEILGPGLLAKGIQAAGGVGSAAQQVIPAFNRGATAVGGVARGAINTVDDLIRSLGQGAQTRSAAREAERATIPSKEVLRTAGGGEFEAAKKLGGNIKPERTQGHLGGIRERTAAKYDLSAETTYPNARSMIEYLERRGEDMGSFENLMTLQREARNFVKRAKKAGENTGDNSDYAAAQMTMKDLDSFVDNLTVDDLAEAGGNPEAALESLRKAKELWARQAKLDVVDDILETARRLDDPDIIKQEFRKLAKNDYEYERFTSAEKKMIEQLARRGLLDDFAHAGAISMGKAMLRRGGTKLLRSTMQDRSVQKFRDMIARGQGDQEARAAAEAAKTPFSEKVRGVMDKSPEDIEAAYRRRARERSPSGR